MSHHCHAEGCQAKVPPRLLFCARHWRMVPPEWQRMVWATYRKGQEVDKRPSPAYLLVQGIVVAMVANLERVWTKDQAESHIYTRGGLVWRHLDPEWVRTLPPITLQDIRAALY